MAEYIEREAALTAIKVYCPANYEAEMLARIVCIPAADVVPVVKAKWEDVHIDRPEIADILVASMFCPNCNRWHNEVFFYGNPTEMVKYCNFCGARMDGDGECMRN